MKTKLALALALLAAPVTAVQISVNVPAGALPACPAGDAGAYTVTNGVLTCVGTGTVVIVPPTTPPTVPPTVPPLPPTNNYCAGADQIVPIPWPVAEQSQFTTRNFAQDDLAFKLVIPTTFNPALNATHTGYISMVEVPGSIRTSREISVSRTPCDFSLSSSLMYGAGGTSPAFSFAVNNPTGYTSLGAAVNFQPGDVIFINVRNSYKGTLTCPIGKACDVLFNYKTPNSY